MAKQKLQFGSRAMIRGAILFGVISSLIIRVAFAQTDMEAILDSNNGTSALSIQDSDTAEVMRVSSDGDVQLDGDITVSGNDIIMGINTTGFILVGNGVSFTPVDLSGVIDIDSTGVTTIQSNSINLATDTTGNYVARIVAGEGIASTGATIGQNIEHTLSVDLKDVAQDAVGTTFSVSGLEFITDELTMLQGCGDNQILKWDEVTDAWHCENDAGGSGFNTLDSSYDEGGPGVGRTITADAGAVQINASGGDDALELSASGTGGVFFVTSTSTGTIVHIEDTSGDTTPFTIGADGVVTTGADAIIGGDLSITGDDLFMATNTSGFVLVADGTNFNPVDLSGVIDIDSTGVTSFTPDSVVLATDTTGNYVARIIPGDGMASTGATTGENIIHTLSVDLVDTIVGAGATGSFSGMEFIAGELTVIQGCADGEVLQWDNTLARWICDPDAGASGVNLDQAYDSGGPGAGRTITADAGAVQIIASGGDEALELSTSGTARVLFITSTSTGTIVQIDDATNDTTPFAIGADGVVTTGTSVTVGDNLLVSGDADITGDLTISGDDLFMATNTSGFVLVADGTNFNPVDLSGVIDIDSTGVTSFTPDSVVLATDTTGNYVARIIAGDGVASTGATIGENITHTLSVDLIDTAVGAGATGSFSGMEFITGELALIQGCSDGEVLQWDNTLARWVCDTDDGTGSTLQSSYDNDPNGSDVTLTLTGTDGAVIFLNPASGGTTSTTLFMIRQLDTTGVTALQVRSDVTDDFGSIITSAGAGTTALTAGLYVEAEGTSGAVYIHRDVDSTTVGTLTLIHEDNATADTDVLAIVNDGTGNSFRVSDQTSDATPFVIDSSGRVGVGTSTPLYVLDVNGTARVQSNAIIDGDLTISGDDLFMATNTTGFILVADGTNFNPVDVTGVIEIDSTGVTSFNANAVVLATDTTGDFVQRIVGGDGVTSTGASIGENIAHTLSVDLLTTGVDGGASTGSVSGLEFINTELTLVTGCTDGQVLKWVEATDSWRCEADAGAGGGNTLDLAYDSGGPGAGRTVFVDSGAVQLIASNGNYALELTASGTSGVLFLESTASGTLVQINDQANDTTPFVIDDTGQVGIRTPTPLYALDVNGTARVQSNAIIGGDLTISGDDLFMATNTTGFILVADGTNFNPVDVTGVIEIDSTGVTSFNANAVVLATDTTGDFVARIIPGDGIASTGTTIGENITHTLSVDLIDTAVGAGATGSFSGMEFIAGDLAMIQGCADGEILQWNNTTARWICDTDDGTGSTLQSTYDNDANGGDATLSLTGTDGAVIFLNPASGGTTSTTLFMIRQLDTTGVTALQVRSDVTDDFGVIISHSADGATSTEAALDIEAEAGAGALFVHRDVGAATTGTLVFVHEDNTAADTDVVMIQNDGTGNSLRVNTGGTQFVVSEVGRVGIGTAAPLTPLHIDNNNSAGTTVYVSGGGSGHNLLTLERDIGNDGSLEFKVFNSAPQIKLDPGTGTAWHMGVDDADGDKFKIAISETGINNLSTFVIDTSGNVGIGNLTPAGSLHVSGGDAIFGADITVSGNDITMAVNTGGFILIADGTSFSPTQLTGDGSLNVSGTFTITPNAVLLGTDTTGDFVQRIVGGDGVTSTGASIGENIAHTLSVDLLTAGADGGTSTGSVSGLEFINTELTLVTGCTDGQVLKWVEATDSWRCEADAGAGGGNTLDQAYDSGGPGLGRTVFVDSGAVQLIASNGNYALELTAGGTSGVLFLESTASGTLVQINDAAGDATPFVIDPSGQVGIRTLTPTAALQVGGNAIIDGDLTVTGNDITMGVNTGGFILIADGTSFSPTQLTGDGSLNVSGTFTISPDAVLMGTDTTGSFVQRIIGGDGVASTGASIGENITHTLSVDLLSTAGGVGATGSFSGMEFIAGELAVIQGCADGDVLQWDNATNRWVCDSDAGDTSTLQDVYDADVDGGEAIITVTGTDEGIIFTNPAAGGITSGTLFAVTQTDNTAVDAMYILNDGTGDSLKVNSNGTMFVISGTGSVTIGTVAPQTVGSFGPEAKLTVNNGIVSISSDELTSIGIDAYNDDRGYGSRLRYGGNGDEANIFEIQGVGDTVKIHINEGGNVGIGTVTPDALLHVAGTMAIFDGDISVTGNDIIMGTNTGGFILIADGTSFSPTQLTGDGSLNVSGTFTITPNAVLLGTDTTGDFVQRIVAGDGVTSTGASTGENIAHTLSVDLLTAGADGGTSTGSVSGLEFINNELTLVTGCVDGQVLKWVESTDSWRCEADAGAGGGNTLDQAYDSGGPGAGRTVFVDSGAIQFFASNGSYALELTASGTSSGLFLESTASGTLVQINDAAGDTTPFVIDPSGQVGIQTLTPTEALQVGGNAIIDGDITVTGNDIIMGTNTGGFILIADGTSFSPTQLTGDGSLNVSGTFTISPDAVLMGTDTTGSFVQRIIGGDGVASTGATIGENITHTLSVDLRDTASGVGATGSFSGMEFISGELALLQGCSDGEILQWDDTLARWVCDTDAGAGGTTLQNVYDNDANGGDALVTLTGTDGSIVFINPASTGVTSTTLFMIRQLDTTGVTALDIRSDGTDDFGVIISHEADGSTTTEAALNIEAEAGAGAMYVHRNVGAATTGTLVFVHEDNAAADTDVVMIQNDGTGNSLRVNSNGTMFVVTGTGRVGIGTETPSVRLEVFGQTIVSRTASDYDGVSIYGDLTGELWGAHLGISNNGPVGTPSRIGFSDGTAGHDIAKIESIYTGSGGADSRGSMALFTRNISGTWNQAITIDAAGQVGIGNVSPQGTLHVSGGDAIFGADITVSGNDITMGVNTGGFILIADGTSFSPTQLTGDGSLNVSGTFTISPDAVLMGTDTTGSFVQRIIGGDGIASTGASTGENITHTLSVDLLSAASGAGATGSFSGMEFIAGELAMVQGCAHGEMLEWNNTLNRWQCGTDLNQNSTLQDAYDFDTNGGDALVTLTGTDGSIVFINPASGGTTSTTLFMIRQLDTTGVTALHVRSLSIDDFGTIITGAGDGATTTEAALNLEAQAGSGAMYVHRNIGAATTGTLVLIHEDNTAADTDVVAIINEGAGLSLRIADQVNDPSPIVVTAEGSMGVGRSDPDFRLHVGADTGQRSAQFDGTVGIGIAPAANANIPLIISSTNSALLQINSGSTAQQSGVGFYQGLAEFANVRVTAVTSDLLLNTTAGHILLSPIAGSNVGINDTTPDAKLDVEGTMIIRNTTTTGTALTINGTSGPAALTVYGSVHITQGNVGIGTANPNANARVDINFINSTADQTFNTGLYSQFTYSGAVDGFVSGGADISGLLTSPTVSSTTSNSAIMRTFGLLSSPTYSGTTSNSGDDIRVYGARVDPSFTGTIGGVNDSVTLFGIESLVSENLGVTGATFKYGGIFSVGGTGDENRGIFVDSSGATTNYAIYVNGGTSYFNDIVGIDDTTPDVGTGGQLLLDVEGTLGAMAYCDEDGNNCFTVADVGGGSSTLQNVYDNDIDGNEAIITVTGTDEGIVFTNVTGTGITTGTLFAVIQATPAVPVGAMYIRNDGTGDSLNINTGGVPFIVTGTGSVGIGGDYYTNLWGAQSPLAVHGLNGASLYAWENSFNGPDLTFQHSRGTSVGSHVAVVDDDELAFISFGGSDGAAFQESASIGSSVDGTVGVNAVPGNLKFYTTTPGDQFSTERMQISSSGNIGISNNSPNALVDIGGTHIEDNGSLFALSSVLTTAGTGQQNRLINQGPVNVTATTPVAAVYGLINLPSIDSTSNDPDVSTVSGAYSRVDTEAGYAGTIQNAYGFVSGNPVLSGTNKITTYIGYQFEGISNAGTSNSGNTAGTITNFGINVNQSTAEAGIGGTLSNIGVQVSVPNGSGTNGTTNNYGLVITGTSNLGDANFSFFNTSNAVSYFENSVGIGDASPDSGTGGQLLLDVEGTMGAQAYCDEDGNNCFTVADIGGSTSLQTAYDNDVNGGDANVTLTGTDGSVIFINPASNGTTSTTAFMIRQLDTTGVTALHVRSVSTDDFGTIITGAGDGATTIEAALNLEAQAGSGALFVHRNIGAATTGTLVFIHEDNASADTDVIMIQNDGNGRSMRVNTAGTNFVIDDSGRVGIGTSTPTRALEINHPSGSNLRLTFNDNNGSALNYTDLKTGSTGAFTLNVSGTNMLTINPTPATNTSGTIVVVNPRLNNMDQAADLAQVMVIDPDNSAIVTNGRLYGIALANITQNAGHFSTGINISSTWDTGISSAADVSLSGIASMRIGSATEQGLLTVQSAAAHNLVGIVVDNDDTTNDTAGIRIDMTDGGGVPLTISPLTTTPNSTAEGGIYYDSDDDNLYVYADGSWVDLTAQGTQTLQQAYNFDANGGDANVTMTGTDGSIIFINPASGGTTSTTAFMIRQLDTTGVTALHVRSLSTDDFGTILTGAGDGATTIEAAVDIEAQAGSGALFVHRNIGAATTGTLVFIHEDNTAADTDVVMIQNDGAGRSFRVNTNGTMFVINSAGNIGIGTTSPTIDFQLIENKNTSTILGIQNTNTGINAGTVFRATSSDGTIDMSSVGAGFTGSGVIPHFADSGVISTSAGLSGGIQLASTATTSPMRFYTGGFLTTNERMRIISSGNVGINDTTPDAKLDVQGTMIVRNTTTTGTALTINGTLGDQALMVFGSMSVRLGTVGIGVPALPSSDLTILSPSGRDTLAVISSFDSNSPTSDAIIVLAEGLVGKWGLISSGSFNDVFTISDLESSEARLLMDKDGHVSIGANDISPDARLDVEGTMIVRNTTISGTALTVNGTSAQQAVTIYGTMTLSMGEINFGSATTIELPNSTGATVNNTGETYLETDQDGFVLQAGSGVAGQIPANTDVQLPLIFQKSMTMVEPDLIAEASENVAFFVVDDFNYPNGIVVTAIRVLTSADSTDEIDIEFWDDPNFGSATKTTIEPLDLDTCAPAADDDCRETGINTPIVPNESFVMIDLDTTGSTDLEWMQVTVWFYVRD